MAPLLVRPSQVGRAGVSAAIACFAIIAVAAWQTSLPREAVLLQKDGVRGRMVAMGRELELEGARAAGQKLILEAEELANGKGRKLASRKGASVSKQTLSAVVPPFAEQYGVVGREQARPFTPPQAKTSATGMQQHMPSMHHAPLPFAMHRASMHRAPIHRPMHRPVHRPMPAGGRAPPNAHSRL